MLLLLWTQNVTSGLNGALSGFVVRVCLFMASGSSSNSRCTEITSSPSELQLVVDGLRPWSFYNVQVAVVNDAGVGPFHPRIIVRTPADGQWTHLLITLV